MDFADRADGIVQNEFAQSASVFGSLALIAHLSGDFVLARGLGNLARLPDGMGERFLAINVFAELDGGHGNERMEMIGRGDHYGVDVLLFLEHFAKVGEDFCFWIFFEDASGVVGVDVADGNDVFAAELFEIDSALAANADAGNVEFFAGRSFSVEAEDVAGNDHEGGGGDGCGAEEGSARKAVV